MLAILNFFVLNKVENFFLNFLYFDILLIINHIYLASPTKDIKQI